MTRILPAPHSIGRGLVLLRRQADRRNSYLEVGAMIEIIKRWQSEFSHVSCKQQSYF